MPSKLWIGGTSGLTRTYFKAYHRKGGDDSSDWLVFGLERSKPSWLPLQTAYVTCDLTTLGSAQEALDFWNHRQHALDGVSLRQIVLSVRPPLVTPRTHAQAWHYASKMLKGLQHLLAAVILPNHPVHQILHISSIAAIGHLDRQHLRSETDPDPDSRYLLLPYDRFKRASEELVANLCSDCKDHGTDSEIDLEFTSLRLGAIFSDDPGCIQCSALALQARVGPYLELCIDCNSGRNAASLMRCIVKRPSKARPFPLRPVYYYTRPLLLAEPLPYGQVLVDFRQSNDIRIAVNVPISLVNLFVALVHTLAHFFGRWICYLESLDYLLQVTRQEHSFASSAVRQDFPELRHQEETILACFRRRRKES